MAAGKENDRGEKNSECHTLFSVVGPLPPVLISRYAKNHSPDDFCLRHSTLTQSTKL